MTVRSVRARPTLDPRSDNAAQPGTRGLAFTPEQHALTRTSARMLLRPSKLDEPR
jgi:hypothetical protein